MKYLLATLLLLTSMSAHSMTPPDFSFEPDTNVEATAKADAEVLVRMAKEAFSVDLDYSDASIERVEAIADEIYGGWRSKPPKDQSLMNLSYMIGGYIGETLRRRHGAVWGVSIQGGKKFTAMKNGDSLLWPTGKAEKRMRNGSEDNLWHYYQYAIRPAKDV